MQLFINIKLLVTKEIRGGIQYIARGYYHVTSYNKNGVSRYLIYFEANNLYG